MTTVTTEKQLREEYALLESKADAVMGGRMWNYESLRTVNNDLAEHLIELDDEIRAAAKREGGSQYFS